jgi:molybdopterin-guanine dinucleotide biosynthesis protein B
VIPVVSFIGHHDSGKTRLLVGIIPLLIERGYHVGAVKHAPHLGAVDRPDSDSEQHLAAGATRVLLRGERTSSLTWQHANEDLPAELERLFAGCDLVLVEGLKHGPWPKIEVFRRGRDVRREPLAGEIDVVAVVTDEHVALPDGVRALSPRDREAIVELIEQLIATPAD